MDNTSRHPVHAGWSTRLKSSRSRQTTLQKVKHSMPKRGQTWHSRNRRRGDSCMATPSMEEGAQPSHSWELPVETRAVSKQAMCGQLKRTRDTRATWRQVQACGGRAGAQGEVGQGQHAAAEGALQQRARAAEALQRRLLARRQPVVVLPVVELQKDTELPFVTDLTAGALQCLNHSPTRAGVVCVAKLKCSAYTRSPVQPPGRTRGTLSVSFMYFYDQPTQQTCTYIYSATPHVLLKHDTYSPLPPELHCATAQHNCHDTLA